MYTIEEDYSSGKEARNKCMSDCPDLHGARWLGLQRKMMELLQRPWGAGSQASPGCQGSGGQCTVRAGSQGLPGQVAAGSPLCDLPSFEMAVSSYSCRLRWGPKRRGPCPGRAALGCSPQLSPVPRGFQSSSPQSDEAAAQHVDSQTDSYVTRPPVGVGPPS